jgi:hypothetical protein
MNVSKLRRQLMRYVPQGPVIEVSGGGGDVLEDDAGEPEDGAEDLADGDAEGGADEGADDASEGDAAEGDAPAEGDAEDDGEELIVSIGDTLEPGADDDQQRAPDWVRELRKSNREKDRRIRELEGKVNQETAAPQAVVVGDKPTLEGCDFDAEKFEVALEGWHNRKREADEQRRQREQAQQQDQQRWATRLDAVTKAATGLKVRDYDDAQAQFEDLFNVVQQGIVLGGPEDAKSSALIRYALGKNPKKAQELAAIKDPVRFAFAVAKLETQLKATPRKSAPPPDTQVRSAVAGAAAVDSQLARLRQEAEKTGDYTKVMAFKNQLKAKQRA